MPEFAPEDDATFYNGGVVLSPSQQQSANRRLTQLYGYDGTYAAGNKYQAKKNKRDIFFKAVLPTIAFAGGGAASAALMGGGAAPASSAIVPGVAGSPLGTGTVVGGASTGASAGSAAPVLASSSVPSMGGYAGTASMNAPATAGGAGSTGVMGKLGKLFGSNLAGKIVEGGIGVYGNKQAQKANAAITAEQLKYNREALALQQAQLDEEIRSGNLDRADALAAQEAMNELKRRELAAVEEERAFNRQQAEYARAKDEAREARLAPRRAMSDAAAARIMAMFGGG